ncbi:predicted protein [Streptomyces sp. SPB78]|uniref:DUF6302 family protein n=1 Tax=Streptomyces sp. (strain SPB78) TaxID=591157 RepID=UPI0001B54874|nr:DUF6302 family protein [Streptomyces sp. SPB78]EFK98220.1 predicted protein [Streptomyces sp. SPB78]
MSAPRAETGKAVLASVSEADPEDTAYFRARLVEPALILRGVAVALGGGVSRAVPVGGARRAGFLPVPEITTGLAVRDLLSGREGFPSVRLHWSPPGACHTVEWGDRVDHLNDEQRGAAFGYRPEAIIRSVDACRLACGLVTAAGGPRVGVWNLRELARDPRGSDASYRAAGTKAGSLMERQTGIEFRSALAPMPA